MKAVVDTYIKEGSSLEVNVSSSQKEHLITMFDQIEKEFQSNGGKLDLFDAMAMFNSCQQEVFTLLVNDSWKRWIRHPAYPVFVKIYDNQLDQVSHLPLKDLSELERAVGQEEKKEEQPIINVLFSLSFFFVLSYLMFIGSEPTNLIS